MQSVFYHVGGASTGLPKAKSHNRLCWVGAVTRYIYICMYICTCYNIKLGDRLAMMGLRCRWDFMGCGAGGTAEVLRQSELQ